MLERRAATSWLGQRIDEAMGDMSVSQLARLLADASGRPAKTTRRYINRWRSGASISRPWAEMLARVLGVEPDYFTRRDELEEMAEIRESAQKLLGLIGELESRLRREGRL